MPWPRGSQPWLSATNVLARVMSKVCCRALVVSTLQIAQAKKKYDKIVQKILQQEQIMRTRKQPMRNDFTREKKQCQPADKTFHQALRVTPMIFRWQRPLQMVSIPKNKYQ